MVGDDSDIDRFGLDGGCAGVDSQSPIHDSLNVSLETTIKVTEHGGSTRQDYVPVQWTTDIDGTVLDAGIDDIRNGCDEVRIRQFRIEEDLRTKEPFESNINGKGLVRDMVRPFVRLDPLGRILVVLFKLFPNIGTDVTEPLLDTLGCFKTLLRWNPEFSFSQDGLDEGGYVSPSDRNVLDTGSDHVPG